MRAGHPRPAVVSIPDRSIVGYEALSRFPRQHESTPDAVFARAAAAGLGTALEAEAIRRALAYRAPAARLNRFLSINLSPAAAASAPVQELLLAANDELTVVEITEQDRVDSYVSLNRAMLGLRIGGLRVAVDDVGSGFANWGHIIHLQPDMIKLDGAWTTDIDADPVRRAMVKAVVTMAAEIDAIVIAEQLESERQLDIMADLGWGSARAISFAARCPSPSSWRPATPSWGSPDCRASRSSASTWRASSHRPLTIQ